MLYASHVLEHLPLKEFRKSLNECRRILKPGGTFRAVVPNFRFYVDQYLSGTSPTKSIEFCLNSGLGAEYYVNPISRVLRGDAHHIMYDPQALEHELRCAGFNDVRQAFYGDSKKDFSSVEREDAWKYPNCVGFECIK
jgi:ubiquinone/menaquinone biosynthesis C-methylase UbiE